MKLFTLTCSYILVAALLVMVLAEPKPERGKVSRYRGTLVGDDDLIYSDDDANNKGHASSGRLFLRKFFSKNIFGQNQSPPIIPIIITGVNTNPDTSIDTIEETPIDTTTDTRTNTPTNLPPILPTNVDTNTDTVTGTLTNEAPVPAPAPAGGGGNAAANLAGRIQLYGRGSTDQNDAVADEDAADVDEQTLTTALAAGAEEYILADQQVQGSSNAKAYRTPVRLNLRLRGSKRGQVISVRIPSKYRNYFNDGQRVSFQRNRRTRPVKRRVIRRRTNRKRNNRNRNKRRRIVAA